MDSEDGQATNDLQFFFVTSIEKMVLPNVPLQVAAAVVVLEYFQMQDVLLYVVSVALNCGSFVMPTGFLQVALVKMTWTWAVGLRSPLCHAVLAILA